ncbi:DUF2163 domain-containing protein [Pontixanthobacter sp. CEM42]|uniref:DUF2163 domain-containing protein n=1 Tax=Pontixanthobacter sp. CEM42 TaxID=2792077 RepID=UPI001ADF9332|nr:DUF2163 domain-containing protein [Pontixanthobacter sp. CEM42]
MSRVFFRKELEGVATFWRVFRRDGVTLGFTSHDRDLYFDGILHRAAPGMIPSAIRRTTNLSPDSAEVQGVLSHESIGADDLAAGRFDEAEIVIGVVDWETLDRESLYAGSFGSVLQEAGEFTADLLSAKAKLDIDLIPRTSPTCRAQFCGPGCTLSAQRFTFDATVSGIDWDNNAVSFADIDMQLYLRGELRWFDGPQTGTRMQILDTNATGLVVDIPIAANLEIGTRARLLQGCDHLLATCHGRFGNAVNFQGEPFLPGNDLLARYPAPQ